MLGKFLATIMLCWLAQQVGAQPHTSARPPGDKTLFGDPDCAYWLLIEPRAKEVWLSAILRPIHMGYMQREKPAIDRFAALASLAPAAHFVDRFCETRKQEKAMLGAVRFFEELVSTPALNLSFPYHSRTIAPAHP